MPSTRLRQHYANSHIILCYALTAAALRCHLLLFVVM
jgi:hypothetical protein